MDLDSQLCYCFHIKKRKVVNFVKQTKPRRASQISQCFGAGTGCGWCIPFLKQIHRQIVAGEIVESDDISSDDYANLRKQYLVGIRDGTVEQNTPKTEKPPVPFCDRSTSDDADSDSDAGLHTVNSEPDWDVSDRYSRDRAPEPEPELLDEKFLAGMDDDDE